VVHVALPSSTTLAAFAAVGVVVGLGLLVRGFVAYRSAGRIEGTAVSRIGSLAAGEVLVSGRVEPSEVLLVSPLQSAECVQYRARIDDEGEDGGTVYRDDRAVGFRVTDATGSIRVFPRAARFDVPDRYDESSGPGGAPIGLRPRSGPLYAPRPDDRAGRIAALLTVRRPEAAFAVDASSALGLAGDRRRRYREARIEPGDLVTILGRALPFGDLSDPTEANVEASTGLASDDAEVAADLAEARAAGLLESSAAEAWGNAAIPGFGIGRPVRTPELDPGANPLPLGTAEDAARASATFDVAPDDLVLAAAADGPLAIGLGAPTAMAARAEWQFLIGLLGAVLSIGSAMILALVVNGSIRA
jgi:hypothetical protein